MRGNLICFMEVHLRFLGGRLERAPASSPSEMSAEARFGGSKTENISQNDPGIRIILWIVKLRKSEARRRMWHGEQSGKSKGLRSRAQRRYRWSGYSTLPSDFTSALFSSRHPGTG